MLGIYPSNPNPNPQPPTPNPQPPTPNPQPDPNPLGMASYHIWNKFVFSLLAIEYMRIQNHGFVMK